MSCTIRNHLGVSARARYYQEMITKYSQEMAEKICERLACGASVADIEKTEGFPSSTTIFHWTHKYPEFYDMFDKAREFGSHAVAYRVIEDIKSTANNKEAISKLKIWVDYWKWYLGKINQRKYGDSTTIKGDKDNPLTINIAAALDHAIAQRDAGLTIEHQPSQIMPIVSQPVAFETDSEGRAIIVKRIAPRKWQPAGSVLTFRTLKAAQEYAQKRLDFESGIVAELNEFFKPE